MFLRRVHLFAIVAFFLCFLMNAVRIKFFPQLVGNEYVSLSILSVLVISILLLWFVPVVRCFSAKELDNKLVIVCLSLFLPVVGGFFSYFLLKGR